MNRLTLAAVLLAGTAFTAPASALTWNFGEHGFGALPNVQQFDTGGFFLTAKGFNGSDQGTALFSKNGGTGEVGLGLNGTLDDEILGSNFIQISVDTIRAQLTNFSFSMNSVDNNEGWAVFGSNDAHPFQFTLLAQNIGLLDQGVHGLADGWDNYNFFFANGDGSTPTGGHNVLLHTFSADVQAVPAPIVGAGIPGLVAACLTMLGFNYRRRRRLAGS